MSALFGLDCVGMEPCLVGGVLFFVGRRDGLKSLARLNDGQLVPEQSDSFAGFGLMWAQHKAELTSDSPRFYLAAL